MRVCVVGLGNVGLPVAVQFALSNAQVTGVDTSEARVNQIMSGEIGQDDTELSKSLRHTLDHGTLRATTEVRDAVNTADLVVVLVRLVVNDQGQPDYRHIDDATSSIASSIAPGTLVSFETTVPVGDTRNRFVPMLEQGSGLKAGQDFHVCFSPERVRAGQVLRDLATYPKIVSGLTTKCSELAEKLYGELLDAEVIRVSSLESAELTKIAENIYRDVNIALANELARYSDSLGINYSEIRNAANSEPLSHLHQPGVGVGGHCVPIYPWFFINRAPQSDLAQLARIINDAMPNYAIQRLRSLIGELQDLRVLILGLSFRGDVREDAHSMTYFLVRELQTAGCLVRVHDPQYGEDGVSARDLVWGEPGDGWAQAVIIQTDHSVYRDLLPDSLPGVQTIIDGRNILDPSIWRNSSVAYAGIGQ